MNPEKIRMVKKFMGFPEKIERNEKIFELLNHGARYKDVAARFDISITCVAQIYNRTYRKKVQLSELKNKEEKNHG